MPQSELLKDIKQRFYLMRNGVIADSYRKTGVAYATIFGLNIPQLKEIAASVPHSAALAVELWADKRVRESRLLAPMVFPTESLTPEIAIRWVDMARTDTTEEIDTVCKYLISGTPMQRQIERELIESVSDARRYAGLQLMAGRLAALPPYDADFNLNPESVALATELLPYVKTEVKRRSVLAGPKAKALLEDITFRTTTE